MRSQRLDGTVLLKINATGFLLVFGNFLRGNKIFKILPSSFRETYFKPPNVSTLYSIHVRAASGKPILKPPIVSTLYSIHARTVSGKLILNPHHIHFLQCLHAIVSTLHT